MVFITRKGNPKGIKGWDDLTKDGVEVITPNPFTSGAAQWNIMAGYGAQIEQGKTEQQGLQYIDALFKNVPVQPSSGREALEVFEAGKGDVLLSYENEAIAAQAAGQDIDYVIPDQTILIENPVAVVNTSENPEAAKAFATFALGPDGQKIFGDNGYRPTDPDVAATFDYPTPPQLFTIDDLGGWPEVKTEFFDPDNGSVTKIFAGPGYCHRVAASPRASRASTVPASGAPRLPARHRAGRALHERDRPDPVRRAGQRRVRQRLGRLLERHHQPAGDGGPEADRRRLAGGRGDQRRHGDHHRVGAGARPLLRARASSTR